MNDEERKRIDKLVCEYSEVQKFEVRGGYIIWRKGTGSNVELLHLRVDEPRQGTGTILFKSMLIQLLENPPYHSVFGFTRTDNEAAHRFYRKQGFDLSLVQGVYADGEAVLFSRSYRSLCISTGLIAP